MPDNVEFDTDMQATRQYGAPVRPGQSSDAGMTGWLIRHGLAKSSASAQTILVVIIVIDIVAMFVVIKYFL